MPGAVTTGAPALLLEEVGLNRLAADGATGDCIGAPGAGRLRALRWRARCSGACALGQGRQGVEAGGGGDQANGVGCATSEHGNASDPNRGLDWPVIKRHAIGSREAQTSHRRAANRPSSIPDACICVATARAVETARKAAGRLNKRQLVLPLVAACSPTGTCQSRVLLLLGRLLGLGFLRPFLGLFLLRLGGARVLGHGCGRRCLGKGDGGEQRCDQRDKQLLHDLESLVRLSGALVCAQGADERSSPAPTPPHAGRLTAAGSW